MNSFFNNDINAFWKKQNHLAYHRMTKQRQKVKMKKANQLFIN